MKQKKKTYLEKAADLCSAQSEYHFQMAMSADAGNDYAEHNRHCRMSNECEKMAIACLEAHGK